MTCSPSPSLQSLASCSLDTDAPPASESNAEHTPNLATFTTIDKQKFTISPSMTFPLFDLAGANSRGSDDGGATSEVAITAAEFQTWTKAMRGDDEAKFSMEELERLMSACKVYSSRLVELELDKHLLSHVRDEPVKVFGFAFNLTNKALMQAAAFETLGRESITEDVKTLSDDARNLLQFYHEKVLRSAEEGILLHIPDKCESRGCSGATAIWNPCALAELRELLDSPWCGVYDVGYAMRCRLGRIGEEGIKSPCASCWTKSYMACDKLSLGWDGIKRRTNIVNTSVLFHRLLADNCLSSGHE
ncbi:hypothetical protein MNV49_002896 [Pseudohyphozyma bogoriensis]|nr:hypothetical protein MNV49_002896 [Pseudohyphozyma bogoriensis]